MSYYGRRGLVGPAVLITIGIIGMAHIWWPGIGFWRLSPLILIVIGLVRLLEMGMGTNDTVYPAPPQHNPPPSSPNAPPPPGVSQ